MTAVALSAVLTLGLAACGGGGESDENNEQNNTTPEFNAAMGKVFNPSDKKGGTLKYAISTDWDSACRPPPPSLSRRSRRTDPTADRSA